MPTAPLVTVLLAVHDGEAFVRMAVSSVLGQTLADLELVVVDDGSTDGTPDILESFADPRVRVLRNEERGGLAHSLNRGLDEARGEYVARLDADDVALPKRLELQLRRIQSKPEIAALGTAVVDLREDGTLGGAHLMPLGTVAVRFAALFGSPFLHPTVIVSRELLERHGLRYDTRFAESEDFDLWTRLLEVAEGENLDSPLTLYRVHSGQASQRRRGIQRDLQLEIAARAIGRIAPALSSAEVESAWRVGTAELVRAEPADDAAAAYLELVHAFERRWGRDARERAARDLARLARSAAPAARARILAEAVRLDPALVGRAVVARQRRRALARQARPEAEAWLDRLGSPGVARPIRVAAVFPEPTPYRAPLLDRIAALPEIDLTVLYAAETVVAGRTWNVVPAHRAVYLRGVRMPGAERLVRHDYPLTPGVVGALGEARPEVVVVSGWSTFAAQAALAWCRFTQTPYVLVVESHDEGPRPGWRRVVKGTVVPPVVRHASGILVTGRLARDSMIARGAPQDRVRVFANTVDVQEFGARADRLSGRRPELRSDLGAGAEDVIVLCVARLGPEKRLDDLVRAVADADDPRLLLLLAGDGPEREAVERLAHDLGIRHVLLGDVDWERIVELYVASDVFALLSERETWGVVVNEAAACGLPLILSDQVGAAHDLLRDGENGALVRAGDVKAVAEALRELAADAERRREQGARSRELARDWGYGPSVLGFLDTVREAARDRR